MRFLLISALVVIPLTTHAQQKPPRAIPVKEAAVVPQKTATLPRITDKQIAEITFQGIAFDSRTHRLIVADQAGGPASKYADSAAAAQALGGIAAVNAGFFTPEGKPLGLVASAGKISGAWNRASSLGSGVWYEKTPGFMGISRREKLGKAAASKMSELIQAGPMLIENGKSVGGLDAQKASARTMILWDGNTRWWIGCCSPCSLAELGKNLVTAEPAGWKIKHALNLDGGRSSDLWISATVSGGPILRRPLWNKSVRNFLILMPRSGL
jgi:Phosphodiester glycosidase